MESIFSRDNTKRQAPSVYDLIKPEIDHLDKKNPKNRQNTARPTAASWIFSIAICALLALYFMDPFLYAIHKTEAIRTYLYLHNNDAHSAAAQALASSQILSPDEISALNKREGSFQDYFASREQAEQKAATIVSYMDNVQTLRTGPYDVLDPVGKLRFLLFTRTGILPPVQWSGLSPSIN